MDSKKKILFVDGDAALLALYAEEFRDEGYEVLIARRADKALSLYRENSPQAVVVDLHLPDMEGMDFLNALFLLDNRVSVIIYDAYPEPGDIWTPRVGGPILKSSDFTQLKDKIKEILSDYVKKMVRQRSF